MAEPASVISLKPPSPASSTAAGDSLGWKWTPCIAICSIAKPRTSSSNPRSGFGWRNTTCTSAPNAWKMPANSSAMYPPPTIAILTGPRSSCSAKHLSKNVLISGNGDALGSR